MTRVLITGATGFVGRALCSRMLSEGFEVGGTLLHTEPVSSINADVKPVEIDPIGPDSSWSDSLSDVNIVVHLAARVHVMHETSSNPLNDFRYVNTHGTANLARQAAASGVKRLVFMSTIGVNGYNSGNTSYTEQSTPHPHNPYSLSKHEAEQHLWQISSETGMEVAIIRAPLVYGSGNPGNFLSLLNIIYKGVPLPLASINNRRSLIYIGNLVDVLVTCATHPDAAGNTYLVSDGEDVSTPELICQVAESLDKAARLFPFSTSLIRLAGKLIGKTAAVNRLIGSLTVDSSKIRNELGWKPPFTMEEGLRETARWFISSRVVK